MFINFNIKKLPDSAGSLGSLNFLPNDQQLAATPSLNDSQSGTDGLDVFSRIA